MFLKRLEAIGFKSFADRISIDFVPGMTAIVGPNGSGKSNITDAIRWVLGEQSAKSLRGAKMEDVIFSGSESRKPLNVAEVTLTLDNSDQFLPLEYEEVSVTRRVYRSGDSEFFINKQPCRLKDIVDLFMDSGVGREAFSIISQGKVEEILSSKPEDRRMIFEDAAGVLKYKMRKKKAEHKLSETEDHLQRVQDILHELNQQLEPLKQQASIAKEYIEKKEQLQTYEVGLIVYEIEQLHEKWEALKEQLAIHEQNEIELATTLQKEEAHIAELRHELTALDESIDGLQQVLLLVSEELEKMEGKKQVLKERKNNAHKQQHQMEQTVAQLAERERVLEATIAEKKKLLQQLQTNVQALQAELKEKNNVLSAYGPKAEAEIERLKSEYIDLVHEQATLKNERTHTEAQLQKNEEKQRQLIAANDEHIRAYEQIVQQWEQKQQLVHQLQQRIAEQEEAVKTKEQQLAVQKEQYRKKEATLYEAYQYVQKMKSKKEMLEAMQQEYAGFFQGVKEVLKAKDRLPGIHGAVVELMTVPSELETAIEVALGGAAQHIVVENEQSAREAIQFLKRHAYGRATFLPLNVIQGKSLPPSVRADMMKHPAYVGVASELISYEATYAQVMTNILGTVIITRDLKGANELARQLQYRYRFVTLDGDVVNPGGAMTGGTVNKQTSSLLSRTRELEEVTASFREIERKTIELEQRIQREKETIAQDEQQREHLYAELEANRMALQEEKSAWTELDLRKKHMDERLAVYRYERQTLEEEKQQLTARLHDVMQQLNELEKNIAHIDEQVQQWTEKKQLEQQSKEQMQEQLTALKVALAEKQEHVRNEEQHVRRLVEEWEETKRTRAKMEEERHQLIQHMNEQTEDEQQLERICKEKTKQKEETIQLIASRREQRLQYQTKLEQLEKEIKELKRQHKQLTDTLKDEEVKLARFDMELDHLLNRLREEYKLSFEAAKEAFPLHIPAQEARKKVKLIQLAIDELGTVNLGAIEEYERVFERHRFLTEQKEDLQRAKDTLYQVIDEMDDEMKRRFAVTFEQIRTQFARVFVELFGGGKADLKLTDPNDLLHTGVDIVAQPPGKKLQHLSLLSGGERALTAIALLFAILNVRPVPFCVLDEVEAALDEANVQRYAKYLKKFSHETQFIVITHRKGTMEEADVLYGVTMQQSGVSKLVSVRLEEAAGKKG
ncbi:chromosome segregation protein SMC [Anoxybacillus gonensis]|uniref:Chromosome partition protein Smc n=1 Tax=Anoxybacillus gonensis TaxID=198467 RepID=A0AAW7TET4_9BACL|nr:chromosome segregation protein SMC [Anoxybacillus gonensis]AKS38017.1 chromosome segregation protein SMC [Anoxybacillus gonensis]KGP60918.1 chromosome segregation protein SMC [Anoxybacillus gonensis]MDO0877313.1 chromosome segregation protein SMC [Anoxybacillus gonensis]